MSRLVRCTCKTHCLEFDHGTQSYRGGGELVSSSTAQRHRFDDRLAEQIDKTTRIVASQVLRHEPPAELVDEVSSGVTQYETFHLDREVMSRSSWTPSDRPLVFAVTPEPNLKYQYPPPSEIHVPNRGPHALDPTDRANRHFLENESRLCEILIDLQRRPHPGDVEVVLADKVYEGLLRMRRHKEVEWDRQKTREVARSNDIAVVDTGALWTNYLVHLPDAKFMQDIYFRSQNPDDPVLSTSFLTILLLHLFFRTPRRATTVLIAGIRSILQASRIPRHIIDLLPKDPRTVVDRFDLDPRVTSYLQCPSCYALYAYTGTGTTHLSPDVIQHCTHQPTPESSPCGVPLWMDRRVGDRTLRVPRRKYVHQSLKEWMGRVLTRPGVEDMFEESFRRQPTGRMEDIWDSPLLRNFRDTDKTPFFGKHEDELRIAFSLGADSFHPLGSLEAKQTMSATALYMVILNFPPHLRYKYKNMYLVGVIPGPGKPSLDQINHAVVLLVQELLEFWKGVYFTRTAKFTNGRLSKGALIALVCDMLAARQMAGFGSATSTLFCTFCALTIQDIENLQKETWPERVLHHHLQCAREWKDSNSERDRERLFRLHGIRWSALLDLPYWNPIYYTVIDSMHAAYLGLFQTHNRRVWGIEVSVEGGDGTFLRANKPIPRPPNDVLRRWIRIIRNNPADLLERLTASDTPKNVLWHICADNGLRRAGGKRALAKSIVEWRAQVHPEAIITEPDDDPSEAMEVDQAGPSDSQNTERFLQRVASSERAFRNSTDAPAFLQQVNQEILQKMCRDRCLNDSGGIDELYARLVVWRNIRHPGNGPKQPNPRSRAVLGKDILEAVWSDMKSTQLPSWMSPAPPNWGTAARGKLTADQWMVICTVHLPITLIRIWGNLTDRRFSLLCNFMDLTSAVQLADQRALTEQIIADSEMLMARYLNGMKSLFKDARIQPIHHIALHAGDFLRLYGPNHSVRAFGGERYLEVLGLQNVNNKSGELEATFTMSVCQSSNLQAFLERGDLPEAAGPLLSAYDAVSNEDHRGTRLADEIHHPPTKPPVSVELQNETYHLLLVALNRRFRTAWYTSRGGGSPVIPRVVLELDKVSIRGVIYASSRVLPRDSDIIFRREGGSGSRVGSIKSIFRLSHPTPTGSIATTIFLLIEEYSPVTDRAMQSTYTRFGFAGGFLCHNRKRGGLHIISSENVVCHFAKTVLPRADDDLMHVLPLNKMMETYTLPSAP